jgi:cytochrome c5
MTELWLLVLTYAVIGLVAERLYRWIKAKRLSHAKRCQRNLIKLLPEPKVSDSGESATDGYRYCCHGAGIRGYGRTAEEARADWAKRLWKEVTG